ncbi:transcriptional regulator [Paractinoplanes durhamensis]|uniref:Transcriptional regulator n=1 Tax=Paractinoplanes durhamensis TaxID=113563 RepID=A0ABQ3YTB3_9ACTN|nr:transcriptional regulator [Actinoplanes durhamensis]
MAGVSVDYYIRLEQGRDSHPSAGVLDALAGALRLDDDEREHLHRLAGGRRGPARPAPEVARAGLRQLLDTVRPAPGFVLTPGSDILAENPEGLALLDGLADWPRGRRNIVRYIFRHPGARTVVVSWRRMAQDCVAHLRTVPPEQTAALVEELVAVSSDFADLWAHYDVRIKSGTQRAFQHPAVGRLELNSEVLTVADGQRLVIFQAVPGSPSADALALLSLAGRP